MAPATEWLLIFAVVMIVALMFAVQSIADVAYMRGFIAGERSCASCLETRTVQ